MSPARAHGQRGFTMIEVLVSLVITVIGLAGVLMMQTRTTRANRQSQEFTRAVNIAEETVETTRALSTTNLHSATYSPVTYSGVSYSIAVVVTDVTANLARVTVNVTYSEDGDSSTADDRTASFELLRTRTELL